MIVRSKDVFAPKTMLYRSGRPVLIIPNLAIHMNREVNKGVAINNQVDLMPVADMLPEEQQSTDYFLSFLAEELAVKKEDILDFELNTYCVEEPAYVGIKRHCCLLRDWITRHPLRHCWQPSWKEHDRWYQSDRTV